MQIVREIWNHLTSFFGTLVLIAGIIGLIVGWIERVYLRSGERERQTRERRSSGESGNVYLRSGEKTTKTLGEVQKRRLAIITGASSGLGMAYAKAIDQAPEKFEVDEIWLVARRKDRLEDLASLLHLPVQIIPLDLTRSESIEVLKNKLLKGEVDSVSLLLNCAGFGAFGSSEKVGYQKEGRMIDLNDRAAAQLTNIVIPYLHPGARIGEVCSVAGLQPIPFFNAYAASKAFLYSYSRALRVELLRKKVSVTAICPYWVRDTGFIGTAMDEKAHHLLFTSTTKQVVSRSLSSVYRRHAMSTPGFIPTLDRIFCGLIPDNLLSYIMTRFL